MRTRSPWIWEKLVKLLLWKTLNWLPYHVLIQSCSLLRRDDESYITQIICNWLHYLVWIEYLFEYIAVFVCVFWLLIETCECSLNLLLRLFALTKLLIKLFLLLFEVLWGHLPVSVLLHPRGGVLWGPSYVVLNLIFLHFWCLDVDVLNHSRCLSIP